MLQNPKSWGWWLTPQTSGELVFDLPQPQDSAWPQHSPNSPSLGEVRRRRQLGSGHNCSAAGVSAGTFVLAALNKCLLAFTHHCLALLSKCIKRFLPRQAGVLSQQRGKEDALLFIRTALTKF